MHEYDDAVLNCFLENQGQLFSENVAESPEEAEAFLEDCMAVVVESPEEVEEYFEEAVKWEKAWDKIWLRLPYVHVELTDDQIEKQLEFMGYVKDLKTHDLYAYVSSNRKINGHWFIHPKKYTDNLLSIEKRPSVPYIYDNWDPYALEGYTKILRHGTEH